MKKVSFFIGILLLAFLGFSQKNDYVWVIGNKKISTGNYQYIEMDFKTSPPSFTIKNKDTGFRGASASVSNDNGALEIFTNGVHIYDKNGEIIKNGDELKSSTTYDDGYVLSQSPLLLPIPAHPTKYSLILQDDVFVWLGDSTQTGTSPLTHSVVDMTKNFGKGEVIEKKSIISADTLKGGELTAVKHANGRDWWIINPGYHVTKMYKRFLLTPNGIESLGFQSVGTPFWAGLGQAAFSPDGEWYARYNATGIIGMETFSFVDIYRFDRCTGLLSDHTHIQLEGEDGLPGGIAFSPNSRFVYASNWDKIYQFDLESDDIEASQIKVAEYDGFTDTLNLGTRFFMMQLAPDNKIYINIPNHPSSYLHVIDQPDSLGVACNVLQHHVELPIRNAFSIPNMPNFRLGALEGSPCDSIISSVETPKEVLDKIKIYPNPTENILHLDFPYPLKEVAQFTLFDNIGQAVFGKKIKRGEVSQTFYLEELPKGIYFYKIETDERKWQSGKVVVF